MGYKTAVWHEYSVDPLELIGKTVRLTIIRRGVVTKAGSEASLSYYFGVVRAIAEPRGETTIDTFDGFQKEAFDFVFDGNYPEVSVFFQGGDLPIKFDPELDAASFEWIED